MEVLPAAKKDRVDNTFYLLNNKIRFWNGYILLCEHKRQKQTCKDCEGSSICKHNRRKETCKSVRRLVVYVNIIEEKKHAKTIGGDICICQHNRIKTQCKDCGGSSICTTWKTKESMQRLRR